MSSSELSVADKKRRAPKRPKGMFLRGDTWWFRQPTPSGGPWHQMSLKTRDLSEAKRFREMLVTLSESRSNSLDLVQRVCDGKLGIRELYGDYVVNKTDRARAEANDPDLSQYVAGWFDWTGNRSRRPIAEGTRKDYLRQVRTLIPEGKPFRRSRLTRKNVESWLTDIDAGSSSTRARYFAGLCSFVKYLRVNDVIEVNPLGAVERPMSAPARDKFHSFPDMQRVLAAMPDAEQRAMIALAYGTGMERTALFSLTAADVTDAEERTIFARGTKNVTRPRYVIVDLWAWSYVEAQLDGKIGHAKLFDVGYESLLDAFYAAQIAVGLVPPLPDGVTRRQAGKKGIPIKGLFHTLHDCRHSYTVNRMTGQDGEPTRDNQFLADQLGHKDQQMVSRIYAKHTHRIQSRAEARHRARTEAEGASKPAPIAISR